MNLAATDQGPLTKRSHTKENAAWAVAVVLVALLAVYAFGGLGFSTGSSGTRTTSTTYDTAASSVVIAAAQQYPNGYNATSLGPLAPDYPGAQSAAYAVLYQSESSANITVIVFDSTNSSESYYGLFLSNVKGLAGYTEITGVLSGYQKYGACYAYGEDVDGIAVANGICTDGNVFLQAHLSSTEPLSELEGDLSSLIGAMYQSVG